MFYKILFLSALIPSISYSLDCGELKEGEVYRLDQKNRSMSNAAIQDQDGLGTCYANQASLLLQSIMPAHPNLSYLNLALYHAADNNTEAKGNGYTIVQQEGKKNSKIHKSIMDSGLGCDAIESVLRRQEEQKRGTLCKAEDAGLEHSFFNPQFNGSQDKLAEQEDTVIEASKYLLSYKKEFGHDQRNNDTIKNREKADEFSIALTNLVRNNADSALRVQCSKVDSFKIKEVIASAITRALPEYPHCLKGKTLVRNNGEDCKAIDSLGYLTKLNYRTQARLGMFLRLKVAKSIDDQLHTTIKSSASVEDLNSKLKNLIASGIPRTISKNVKDKLLENIFNSMLNGDKDAIEDEFKKIALGDTQKCMENNFLSFFADKENFLKLAQTDPVLCNYNSLLENINLLANALPRKTIKDMTSFIDFLTIKEGNLKYDANLMKIVANDCNPSERLMIPKNTKCKMVETELNPSILKFSPKFNAHTQNVRKAFLNQFAANRPVGIDICTRYWYDQKFDLHANSSATKYKLCNESGPNGIHAITMVGYRCQNKKIQYLAQNSWGPNWSLKDPNFEIENGKIWLDEDKLMKNLLRYNTISK